MRDLHMIYWDKETRIRKTLEQALQFISFISDEDSLIQQTAIASLNAVKKEEENG